MLADGSGPPVLLLHGSGPGTTAAAWAPLVAALAPRHRVIAPDLLGFGDESAARRARCARRGPRRRSSSSTRSASRSFAVVGNSAGGAIALVARVRAPAAVTPGRRGRLDGPSDAAARRARRAVGLRAEPRARRAALIELLDLRPGGGDAGGGRGAAARRRWRQPWYPELFPAPRQRWVDDLVADARGAGRDRRAGAAGPRRAGPRSCRCATASCRCCELLPDVRAPRVRPLRPRLTARAHRRVQPPCDHVPGDRPMTDFAVLRAPVPGAVRGRDGRGRRPRRRRATAAACWSSPTR